MRSVPAPSRHRPAARAARRARRRVVPAVLAALAASGAWGAACGPRPPAGGAATWAAPAWAASAWAAPAWPAPAGAPRAHAHNDYVHARPLLDALERGAGSVEADVHLVGGALLVAHHRDSVEAGRTLERLYLDPLRARLARPGAPTPADPLVLLIDVKSAAGPTYAAVERALGRYPDVVTRFEGGAVVARPVLAVLSGERAVGAVRAAPVRHVALDGRLADLYAPGPGPSPGLVPLVSEAWERVTPWRGDRPPPPGLADSLRRVVARAHAAGRRVRFWGTPARAPARERVWRLLRDAGVDYLGADDLDAVRAFLARP
jgi:hypothetical protein